jgi:hypothetical protein
MTIFRFSAILIGTLFAVSDPAVSATWEFRDFSQAPYHSIEAVLTARDGRSILTINCSHAGDPTISIQYRPDPDLGLSMGPVVLDWDPPKKASLAAKLIWEPNERGTIARDGSDDQNASNVAAAIQASPGTIKIITLDIGGERSVAFFDNGDNRGAIGRVLAACSPNPKPPK